MANNSIINPRAFDLAFAQIIANLVTDPVERQKILWNILLQDSPDGAVII